MMADTMIDSVLVTICVPIYNVHDYIERCARSLFEQTYTNLEFLFVDDCSPDDSVSIVERVLLSYPNRKDQVRIVHHEKNRGLAAARNTAVENARGEFLTHVDSDDWLEIHALELLVRKQQETGADIVSGTARFVMTHGDALVPEPVFADKKMLISHFFSCVSEQSIWKRLIRTSLYTEYNIQAKEGVNYGEDREIVPMLFYYASKYDRIDDVVYNYNMQNASSLMASAKVRRFDWKYYQQNLSVYKILLLFFKDKGDYLYSSARFATMQFLVQDVRRKALRFFDQKAYDDIRMELAVFSKEEFKAIDCQKAKLPYEICMPVFTIGRVVRAVARKI